MKRNAYRDWIRTGLLAQGKSKGGLAKALDVHQSQVTRLLDGSRQLKAEEVPIVARYLEAIPPDMDIGLSSDGLHLFDPTEQPPPAIVRIVGYVGAGAAALATTPRRLPNTSLRR